MAVLRKHGMMRNFLIEPKAGEPAPRKVHTQFLDKFPLAADPVQ